MAIYLSEGLRTSRLKEIETESDFKWLINYQPQIVQIDGDKKKIKEKANYFISGKLSELKRNDDNLVSKTLISLDYDDLRISATKFKRLIRKKLKDISYILYATISHTQENPRYRLIVDLNRNIDKSENKKVLSNFANYIGEPIDKASMTYSQLSGLPICTVDDISAYEKIVQLKFPLNVDEYLYDTDSEEITDEKESVLAARSTTVIMKSYVKREYDNLKDYGNWISALTCLAKSVQVGEITRNNAIKYAEMLGLDNEEWKKSSVHKLNNEINNPNLKTSYTFMNKFSKRTENTKILDTYDCSQLVLGKYKFIVIGTEETSPLFMYMGDEVGIYTSNFLYMQRKIYKEEPRYTERQISDVLFKIKMHAPVQKVADNKKLICLNNGIFDCTSKELLPFTSEKVFISKVATNYKKNAKKPYWDIDSWILDIACQDKEVEQLLWQLLNECLNTSYTRGKYFILYGNGSNGKGSWQVLVESLIGEENISNLKLEQIGERFMAHNLVGKTVNIGDDIAESYIEDNSLVQSITTGDRIMFEAKGKTPYPITLNCTLMFSANNIPKLKNKTNGTYRRLTLIPFNADFSGSKEDRSIKDEKLRSKEVLEYVLYKTLQLDFKTFIIPSVVKEALNEYKVANNPILDFYKNTWENIVESTRIPISTAYKEYCMFCNNNGYKLCSQITFSKEMFSILGSGWMRKKTRLSTFYIEDWVPEPDKTKVYDCFCKIVEVT